MERGNFLKLKEAFATIHGSSHWGGQEGMNSWNSPPQQVKYPYQWSTIEYNSINTGTSENIFWSNSRLQCSSLAKIEKQAIL